MTLESPEDSRLHIIEKALERVLVHIDALPPNTNPSGVKLLLAADEVCRINIPAVMTAWDKELLTHIKLLSFTLASVLKKAGMAGITLDITGKDLIRMAKNYIEACVTIEPITEKDHS